MMPRTWQERPSASGLAILADLRAKWEEIKPPPIPEIIESTAMVETKLFRMCRSKRRRIVKKWLTNPKNYRTAPRRNVLVVDGLGWVCHPSVAVSLRAELNQRQIMPHIEETGRQQ